MAYRFIRITKNKLKVTFSPKAKIPILVLTGNTSSNVILKEKLSFKNWIYNIHNS